MAQQTFIEYYVLFGNVFKNNFQKIVLKTNFQLFLGAKFYLGTQIEKTIFLIILNAGITC